MLAIHIRSKSCLQAFGTLLLAGIILLAADPAWKTKPAQNWTPEEAKQVLADSPWSKVVYGDINRPPSEDQRREGGNMGDAKGIGYDGIEKINRAHLPKSIADIFKPTPNAAAPKPQITLLVRWESALPLRMAELKAGSFEPPTLEGDGYKIAVYGIPTANVKGDPKKLGEPLKDNAFLRREGKKDVKAISCEVFQQEDSMVAVFLFPLSAEINKKDTYVIFATLIGRISLQKYFNVQEMQFQGKLDL